MVKKFPAFYWTRKFINVFTRGRYTFPSYFPNIHPNIILSSMPRSSKWSLAIQGFPAKCFINLPSLPCQTHSPSDPNLLDLITLIIFGEEYKLRSSLLCSLHQLPATSSPLVPNIPLSTLFSSTPCLSEDYTTNKRSVTYTVCSSYFSKTRPCNLILPYRASVQKLQASSFNSC